MLSKGKVRKHFISKRKQKYFAAKISFFKPLTDLINKRKKKIVSLYYPSNYEFDTIELFKLINLKKNLLTSLPVIMLNDNMKFVKWKLFDPLKINKYGFLEPAVSKKKLIPDLILLPLVAFDKFKNRLGYGKGFYDKLLLKYQKKHQKVTTIGLAFSFQKYKKIPISKFDVKLDYILTEKGIF